MQQSFFFKAILTENGWLENAVLVVDENGKIVFIAKDDTLQNAEGYALPGFQNAHSHAFQYAMAGLAERHDGNDVPDDFWSWRTVMYHLALTLSPDDLENIATMLYAEMLRHGYTSVAEFHYLHHDKNGKPYSHLAEMGERLVSAAKTAGIRITLIPIFYQQGGFGQPAFENQRRFISADIDAYHRLLDTSKKLMPYYDGATIAAGVHSLRAVKAADIINFTKQLDPAIPFHIHVAEQLKEVEDCKHFYGMRPVEWLLENCDVNAQYNLVHATHLNDDELTGIAKSGANVVLCPSTEGNLGDGLFRFEDYKNAGGNWCIGTDSHIGLNPLEELRLLDYGQRLTTHQRTTFYKQGHADSGFNAIKMAWQSGSNAMGANSDMFFKEGDYFDAVVVGENAPLIACSSLKNLCNTIVYAADVSHLSGTIVNGKWIVENGIHKNAESITTDFINTMKVLKYRM